MSLRKKLPKWLNSELIFYIAIAFLPFENFSFAPSTGWAAITPLLFGVYLLLNLKRIPKTILKLRKIFIFFIVAICLGSLTSYLLKVNTIDYINSFVPLILGAVSLLTFFVFYEEKKDLRLVVNIAVIVYAIAAIVGLFEYLSFKLGNISFIDSLGSIMKRNYLDKNRVQFFFTEPSFIGMHLFGVLLPLYWLSHRKDLLFVLTLIAVEAVAFGSGVRVALDIAVVAILYFFYTLKKYKKLKYIPLILLVIIIGFSYLYNNNARIKKIIDNGVYSDGSFASRYFRSEASIVGYTKAPLQTLVGFGMGNSLYPLHLGYDEAEAKYKSSYTREVDDLGNVNYHEDSVTYNLYTRFISEFGLILTIIAIIYLFKITKKSQLPEKWLYLSVILYIYIQFESLSFYAIWLFVAVMYYTRRGEISGKELEKRIEDNTKGRPHAKRSKK